MGLPVSPERTSWLFRLDRAHSKIDGVLGTRRQTWLEGLGQQLVGQPDEETSEPMERMDPSALAARIGMRPKGELPASRPANQKSDGSAPWRKALRG